MKFPFDTRILKFALAGGAAAYAVQLFTTGYVGSGNLLLESSLSEAEKAFRTALDVGMKRDEEKAAVMLNLAAIQSSKRRTKEAKALLAQAKRLDKKGMLKSDIRTIENAIKNPQQVLRRR